jgi:hypothetical protein
MERLICLSVNDLTNIDAAVSPRSGKVSAPCDDVHTTVAADEVKSLANAFSGTGTSNMVSIDIQDDAPDVLTTGTGPDGSSIVLPTAGLLDYAALQAFTHELLTGHGRAIAAARAPVPAP